jgi:hypothetical protein
MLAPAPERTLSASRPPCISQITYFLWRRWPGIGTNACRANACSANSAAGGDHFSMKYTAKPELRTDGEEEGNSKGRESDAPNATLGTAEVESNQLCSCR